MADDVSGTICPFVETAVLKEGEHINLSVEVDVLWGSKSGLLSHAKDILK